MATLSNPQLSITPTPNGYLRVRASIHVAFTPDETAWLGCGLVVRMKCSLLEDDGPTGNDTVVFLFPNNRVTQSGTVVFEQQVVPDTLNQEPGNDEIKAHFEVLVPGLKGQAFSPIVSVQNS